MINQLMGQTFVVRISIDEAPDSELDLEMTCKIDGEEVDSAYVMYDTPTWTFRHMTVKAKKRVYTADLQFTPLVCLLLP